MTAPQAAIKGGLILNALQWFQSHFRQSLLLPIENTLPNCPFPREIEAVLVRTTAVMKSIQARQSDEMPLADWFAKLASEDPNLLPLFARIILLYRRHRATHTERLTEKTHHLELAAVLEEEVNALEVLTNSEDFLRVQPLRLPRLKDFLPVQYIEAADSPVSLLHRQFDEKFHILQAPTLFLPDLGFFRAKCEGRDTPLAVAFIDIDGFKAFNTRHGETKVDRNLLPRFMQALEAHVFHHGFAYRQGGDEYLVLLPSLSRPLSVQFMDELRRKFGELSYPEVAEKTTVSIGLCVVDSDCPFTDRELLRLANRAKDFAKRHGKNCLAAYRGPRFIDDELERVRKVSRAGQILAGGEDGVPAVRASRGLTPRREAWKHERNGPFIPAT